MYFTSDSDRAFEQPQPRPEQPDEAAPGLENSVLENPTSDNPTPGNPTLENPMQLNDVGVKTINKFNPIPYSTLKNSYFVVYRRGLGNI